MAVAFLTPGTANTFDVTLPSSGASTTISSSVDGGNASDKVVVAKCGFRNANTMSDQVQGMSFNSVAMSAFGANVEATQCCQRMFYLALGSGDLSGGVPFSVDAGSGPGTNNSICSYMVFSGVDQTTPQDGYGTANGVDTSVELDITSAVGDHAVLMFTSRASGPTSSAPTSSSYTERWDNVNVDLISGGGDAAGAAAVEFRAALTASIGVTSWVAMGANLNAAAGGGGSPVGPLIGGKLVGRGLTGGRLAA